LPLAFLEPCFLTTLREGGFAGAERSHEPCREFAPVNESRGQGLADFARAELQQPESRASRKGLAQALRQLRRKFRRVTGLSESKAAVRRQFEGKVISGI